MTSTPSGDRSTLTDLVPAGTVLERVLRAGDKSLVIAGRHAGRPVVVKVLMTIERFWRDRFVHEIAIYRALAAAPAPLPAPGLVHTDGERVLVLDRLPGRLLHTDRHPARALAGPEVTAAIDAVRGFGAWMPPAGTPAPVFDYAERVERYRDARCFDEDSCAVLHLLIDELGAPDRLGHGDPLPANLLVDAGSGTARCALLDFEFTGVFLPGFDLAVLHTVLAATPGAQERIRAIVATERIEHAFLLNRAIVLARELRIHRELDAGPLRCDRLARIRPQLEALARELRGPAAAH